MFDEVRTMQELPAPVGLPEERLEEFRSQASTLGFQTKAFDCLLDRYVLTADGSLLRQSCSWDTGEVLEEERLDFHGRFEMHTVFFADDVGLVGHNGLVARVLGPESPAEAYAISYVLKFTDGQLVAIEKPSATRL
jgi:hypothetical protein